MGPSTIRKMQISQWAFFLSSAAPSRPVCQIINPFLNSKISANRDKVEGLSAKW